MKKLFLNSSLFAMICGMLIGIVTTYFYCDILINREKQNTEKKIAEKEILILENKDKTDYFRKRFETLNDFMKQVKIKEIMQKKEEQDKMIKSYENEKTFSENTINTLKNKVTQLENTVQTKIENKENQIEQLKTNFELKINDYKTNIDDLNKKLKYINNNNFLLKKNKRYRSEHRNLSDLVLKIESLKILCALSTNNMLYKEKVYHLIFKQLKKTLKDDKYIQSLKPIKIYDSVPFVEKLKNTYSKDKKYLDMYIIESNNKLEQQLNNIINHFNKVYLK